MVKQKILENASRYAIAGLIMVTSPILSAKIIAQEAPEQPSEVSSEEQPSGQENAPVASVSTPDEQDISEDKAISEAEPEKDFQKFSQYAETSYVQVNYEDYVRFMNSYSIVDKARVKLNYELIRTAGARSLILHLQYLKTIPVAELSRNDQLAYWLNLRNLLVVFAVAVENSKDISQQRGTFDNPGELWTKTMLDIDGVDLSINDIEKNIILANWKDPNIIYGLYQGVLGGPPLYKPGFRGDNVYDILPRLGRRYLNGKNTVSIKSDTAKVPEIYGWYEPGIFKGDQAKLIKHVRRLSKEKLLKKMENVKTIAYSDMSYGLDNIGKIKRKKAPRQVSAPRPQPTQRQSQGSRPRSGS